MGRRNGIVGVLVSISRDLDRAAKRAERDRARREREQQRYAREMERYEKAGQRADEKARRAAEKEAHQARVAYAKAVFEDRCEARREARSDIEDALLK